MKEGTINERDWLRQTNQKAAFVIGPLEQPIKQDEQGKAAFEFTAGKDGYHFLPGCFALQFDGLF